VLDNGQQETRYLDLDSLSRATLGEVLPLRAFPDWVAGRPWAGAPSSTEPQGFAQLGWTVTLADAAEGRIEAVRPAAPRVSVRVRLERPGS
jgi:outer membrane lipoprotein LolB